MPLIRTTLATCAFVVASAASVANADDAKQACVEASDRAQSLRDEHKLKAARDALVVCAGEACPGPVRKACGEWLAAVDKAQPSIVAAAKEGSRDVTPAALDVDGVRLREALDGLPVPIDPGVHVLKFTAEGRAPVEMKIVVREGEKDRAITAEFGAAVHGVTAPVVFASPTTSGFRMPIPTFVFGGLGVAAFGSFATFGIVGKNDLANLRDTCGVTHSCAQSAVDSTHTKLLVADISLVVGITAITAATVFAVLSNRHTTPDASAEAQPFTVRF